MEIYIAALREITPRDAAHRCSPLITDDLYSLCFRSFRYESLSAIVRCHVAFICGSVIESLPGRSSTNFCIDILQLLINFDGNFSWGTLDGNRFPWPRNFCIVDSTVWPCDQAEHGEM